MPVFCINLLSNVVAVAEAESDDANDAGLLNSDSESEEELNPDDFSEEVCTPARCSNPIAIAAAVSSACSTLVHTYWYDGVAM